MKFIILTTILLSLYLIKLLTFPKPSGNRQGNDTPQSKLPDEYEVVTKNRFVLPDQSNSKQRDDRKELSDKQVEKPHIFATGNDNPNASVIPSEELDEVFGEEVNPEDLDIEPDENETDDDEEWNAEEEEEDIRQDMGEIEGYADGFSYDELTTVIHHVNNEAEKMTQSVVETLRSFVKTDMFEQLVSSDAANALRIASILERNEQSLVQSNGRVNDKDTEFQNIDMKFFFD